LQKLCVPADVLGAWHYFYAKETVTYPFANLREPKGDRDVSEVLLATGAAIAASGRSLLGAPDDAQLVVGFHRAASREEIERAVVVGGHEVRYIDEEATAEPPTPDGFAHLLDEWESDAVRAMLRSGLAKGDSKAALAYIDHGGRAPDLEPAASEVVHQFHRGLAHWTERHKRVLDVFVALTAGKACPRWATLAKPLHVERGVDVADAAGLLRDALVARGVPETVVLEKVCEPAKPGSQQRAFGHPHWPSRPFLVTSWFARLDEVARLGSDRMVALLHAAADLAPGPRELPAIALERWCRSGGFEELDLAGLEACAGLAHHEGGDAFRADAARIYRGRAIGGADTTLGQLLRVATDRRLAGPFDADEQRRFDNALAAACARDDSTLADWSRARALQLVDESTYAFGVIAPFRRAVAAGFRGGEHGFGDQEGFVASAAAIAAHEPDLCLRGFIALTARFNEHGLRSNLRAWNEVVPTRGFSSDAVAEAVAHFSHPARRAEAKILKAFLAARGLTPNHTPPPPLETIDAQFDVGTDVAHLLIGSFDAVEAVAEVEAPDAWPAAVKKQKCVGLETGGDGTYSVRVVGSRSGVDPMAMGGDAAHRATFPLVIKGDGLTVSGIVGAGGTPTVSFPSGSYAADVFHTKAGEVLVVVTPVDKAPAWKFKKGLPSL
jgi:hypothetical protein